MGIRILCIIYIVCVNRLVSRINIIIIQTKLCIISIKHLCNNYACLQALVNNALTWQSSCVIANNTLKNSKSYLSKAIISKFTM